jgi:hypothetical protein
MAVQQVPGKVPTGFTTNQGGKSSMIQIMLKLVSDETKTILLTGWESGNDFFISTIKSDINNYFMSGQSYSLVAIADYANANNFKVLKTGNDPNAVSNNIVVTVKDIGGNVMRDIDVQCDGVTKTTDTFGQVIFEITGASKVVTVEKTDYVTVNQPISPMDTNVVITFLLATEGTITFTVFDGNPASRVEGAQIAVKLGGSMLDIGYTDVNGNFTTKKLPYDDYLYSITKDLYTPIDWTATTINNVEEAVTDTLYLIVDESTVTFTVLDELAVPVENASVVFNGETVLTDVSGEAVFLAVPYGEYTANITKSTFISQIDVPVTLDTEFVGLEITLVLA